MSDSPYAAKPWLALLNEAQRVPVAPADSLVHALRAAAAKRAAKDGPAWPVPMMIASKLRDTKHLLYGRAPGTCAGPPCGTTPTASIETEGKAADCTVRTTELAVAQRQTNQTGKGEKGTIFLLGIVSFEQ